MPCPLFISGSPGFCTAQPDQQIEATIVRTCCKRGYARSRCALAAGVEADAVSFMVKSDGEEGATIAWAIERDHLPVAVGTANAARPETGNPVLDAQIVAYAVEYRKRREA